MARGELTVHPPILYPSHTQLYVCRNDVDIYMDGDLDYNIRYNQFQAEFLPINFDLRHFNLQMGLRWDYMHYRNKLGSETSKQVTLKTSTSIAIAPVSITIARTIGTSPHVVPVSRPNMLT